MVSIKPVWLLLLLITILHLGAAYNIWPKPKNIDQLPEFFSISANHFMIFIQINNCKVLDKAAYRYWYRFFAQDCSKINQKYRGINLLNSTENFDKNKNYAGQLSYLSVDYTGPCEPIPGVDMDESYSIIVNQTKDKVNYASIQPKSVWGALRGLETFSQMIKLVGKDQFIIHSGNIQDSPRFPFRGLLIDTSRHFIPMHEIYETLDAMEMNKLNVLHWHIVDDQSFPFVSETFPELSKKGAYRPTYVYTVEDVQNVLDYAHDRGIRVLPEFDTPGHTLSWGKGQPGLLTDCYDENEKPTGTHGPINPILNSTYTFIDKLFQEIAARFPFQYLHLGGDEVDFSCWKSNPSLQQFMKDHNFGDNYAKLESYYMQKLVKIVENLNRSYIVWQEVFDNNATLKPETLVHVWKGFLWPLKVKLVTKAGFPVLVSSCWYLDLISYGKDWQKYYLCDPQQFNGTEAERKLVLGGEVTMWAEYIDGSNLISRTWPRACAAAERLWSDATVVNITEAEPRFHAQRCRMQLLGIKDEPADGADYCWCDDAL